MNQTGGGQPRQIVHPKEGGGFYVDHQALQSILLADAIKDKPVTVVAVAGAYRTGKSFLLNFLLRYLRNGSNADWMEGAIALSEGFDWSGGHQRHTTGIWLWSEPFMVSRKHGGEVAVLLMDTQGMFDLKSSARDATAIFTLITLASSVLVYNIKDRVQSTDLEHLSCWSDWACKIQEPTGKPTDFQKIVFLVRDWSNSHEIPYGKDGGSEYLRSVLKISPGRREKLPNQERENLHTHNAEQEKMQIHLRSCFHQIEGFLLPHPGLEVAQHASTAEILPVMEEEFKEHVHGFTADLFAPENLVPKMVDGKDITCGDWHTLFVVSHYTAN